MTIAGRAARATRADALRNLGRNLRALAVRSSEAGDTVDAADARLGRTVDSLLHAGLKATLEGIQTDKQIAGLMVELREAINRKAARKARKT